MNDEVFGWLRLPLRFPPWNIQILVMHQSNSQATQQHLSPRKCKTSKTFELEESDETESSNYEFYNKSKTKQEAFQNKILMLERKVMEDLGKWSMQIDEQRVKLKLLSRRVQDYETKRKGCLIDWGYMLEELQSTMEYFVCKLKDYHCAQDAKIQAYFENSLSQLANRLAVQQTNTKQIQQQLQLLTQQQRVSKYELQKWIRQNLKSKQIIHQLESCVKKICLQLKASLESRRIARDKEKLEICRLFQDVKKDLNRLIIEEKIVRENNKEYILEMFEAMAIKKGHEDCL